MDKKVYLGSCEKRRCPGPVHVVEPGDTLYGIAQKYHTRVRVLLALNPYVDIYNLQPGDEICIPGDSVRPPADFIPCVIKKGETIESFLKQHDISLEDLLKLNRGLAELPLPEGMILLLPQKHLPS